MLSPSKRFEIIAKFQSDMINEGMLGAVGNFRKFDVSYFKRHLSCKFSKLDTTRAAEKYESAAVDLSISFDMIPIIPHNE